MITIINATHNLFAQIENALNKISNEQYTYKNPLMTNATIGQHVRHIVELFKEMITGYGTGNVNYENRERNFLIESDKDFAIANFNDVIKILNKKDKPLLLFTDYSLPKETVGTTTSYSRELIYNIEHCIHHMALIRIAFKSAFNIDLDIDFGVAPSTLKYRKQCAQ